MPITGGTLNGAVMADLVADKQRIEAKLKTYMFLETVTYAAQAVGTIGVGFIPRNARVLRIGFNQDTSMGSTTAALGIVGAAAKYRVAATFTTLDQWVWFELNAALGLQLTGDEVILLTTAVAALPGSGRLLVATEFLFA